MNALDALISGASSTEVDSQSDTVRDVIMLKIMEMATQQSMPSIGQQDKAITIGEIDMLNRTAERAKTDLELQKTSAESQKTQLESLIILYETLQIIENENKAPVDPIAETMANNNSAQSPQGEQMNRPSDEEIEYQSMPRIGAIVGTAGNFEAYIVSPGGSQEILRVGDYSSSGFEIISITNGQVVLKGDATGNEYNLRPQAKAVPASNSSSGRQPNQAIDLGGLPLSVF
jgi:hypothetical protein